MAMLDYPIEQGGTLMHHRIDTILKRLRQDIASHLYPERSDPRANKPGPLASLCPQPRRDHAHPMQSWAFSSESDMLGFVMLGLT